MTRPETRPVALVMAKIPVTGQVKTRLAATVGPEDAARLALAALLDTLDVCEETFGPARCYLALAGELDQLEPDRRRQLDGRFRSWHVLSQLGRDFGDRLERAHADVHETAAAPVVQVGMDTPHLDATVLARVNTIAAQRRPVLGPAVDGGWWVLASTEAGDVEGLRHVPMSTSTTGADTLALLRARRRSVVLAPRMRDIDDSRDAELAARRAPHTRFAHAWRELVGTRHEGWTS
ncbi:MAG TPA: DUF2064 domain-containing protein [Nocardioidaceae bacterium]|nr:DUF2064 domain-containing protein [Nocardioidaceae bacterium]